MEMEIHEGQVGNNVIIQCPDWDVWTDVTSKEKYLCRDPCEDKLIQAGSQQTARKDRIHLNNTGHHLIVTMTNLQKEDSGTYVCGVNKFGYDPLTKFTLGVTDLVTTPSSTSMKPTTYQNPSPSPSDVTTTLIDGKAIALTVVGIVVLVILVILLIIIKCKKRKPRIRISTPGNDYSQEDFAQYANIPEDVKWRRRHLPPIECSVVSSLKHEEGTEELYINSAFASRATTQASAARHQTRAEPKLKP
ncbi:unnamed protein product [Lota lota]